MVSIQRTEYGRWRPEDCRALPFDLSYGNLSSFPHPPGYHLAHATHDRGCQIWTTSLPGLIPYNTLVLSRAYSSLDSVLPFGRNDSKTRVFSVRYSVHKTTSLPQQSVDGKWDCSVPLLSSFSHHFPCDRQPQCRNGEDEAHCNYSMDDTVDCPMGFSISQTGGCYIFPQPYKYTWAEASDKCAEMSGRLVTLKSPGDFETLQRFPSFKSLRPDVFVGLRTAGDDLLNAPLSYM